MKKSLANRSIWNQCKIVIRKNFLIYKRDKSAIGDFLPSTFCLIIQCLAKYTDEVKLRAFVALLTPICYVVLSKSVVSSMITEKSDRQKETQKIMGLKSVSYSLGWIVSNSLRFFCVMIFFLALAIPTGVMEYDQTNNNSLTTKQAITGFVIYSLAQLQICQIIASISAMPIIGAALASLTTICGFLGSSILIYEYVKENAYVVYIACLLPSFCYNFYPFVSIVGWNKFDFTKTDYFLMLIFDTIFYGLLAQYLDKVVPNSYGTNKHPLFFLGVKYKKKKQNQQSHSIIQPFKEEFEKGDEDFSSAICHENIRQQFKKAIEVNELKKYFGETKAVDNLTLQIYESQILCLLGHNGSGKTTLISLLTGSIKKDQGQIKYYGKDTDYDTDEIRSLIGLCPQKDVLYDKMTVLEHLEYYGKIKGMTGVELQQSIDEVVERCALQQEVIKLAKQLSGGNKRKLCLAIALMNLEKQQKIIYTSGMDPATRRKIWSILLQMKNEGRCLILTTHHLDEAEVLSERIAIMAQGKLLTVGSVDYIKKNFGIGYHLNIQNLTNNQNNWKDKQEKIKSLVISQIQESQLEPQSANECVSFCIPFDCKNQLLTIFERLENDDTIQINLMMNTLEEAFINIGKDEEAFFRKAQNESFMQQQVEININDEFSQIIPPACLQNDPKYSFNLQFKACFLRQLYGIKGRGSTPVLLIILSMWSFGIPLFARLAKSHFNLDENQEDKNNYDQQMYQYSFIVYIFTFVILVLFMSISSTIIMGGFLIKERQLKLKYSLFGMGCRIWPYWISNFVFDTLVSSILFIIYSLAILIFQVEPLNYPVVYVLLFFTIMTYVTLPYLLSWIFLDFLQAIVYIMLLIFLIFGTVLYFFIYSQVVKLLLTFLIPSVSFLAGLIANLNKYYLINNEILENMEISVVFVENSWIFVIILIFQTILYFFLAVAIEYRKKPAANSLTNINESTDNDVIQEANRVQDNSCSDQIIAKQISKTYANGFQALKGTSFGVESGSILGLLGPNGSGKSTTFNLITYGLKPTTGIIRLKGQEIEKGKGEIFQNVGICSQTDCLFQILTVKHHLQIQALLKGLDGQDAYDAVQYFLKVMLLEEYQNTFTENLSGGNKRKLCVALALMGGTNIQFFDEPSSGVDPIARRFLWNAIQNGIRLRNGAVILTTHTMDEAESLCSKIAIQVNGQFSCFGSPQHLKQKFGDGYRASLELEDEVESESVVLVVKNNNIQIVKFQKKIINFSFYQSFNFFLGLQENSPRLIKDFQLNQATLESVFQYITSQQQLIEMQILKQKNYFCICCGNNENY